MLKRSIATLGMLALLAGTLAGCNGGGSDGAQGPAGTAGATGPAGATGKDATAVAKVGQMTPEQWADSNFTGTITGVDMSKGTPVVSFKVTDANGNPVTGLGNTSKSATAVVASYPNLAFSIAKLVPGTLYSGSGARGPSRWVSYVVANPDGNTLGKPGTDNTGSLTDNGDGSYVYTFRRNVTGGAGSVQDIVSKFTDTATSKKADLGDLTYEPNLTHRVAILIQGNARGTGTNTADAVQVVPAVALKTPVNVFYDFVPASGTKIADSETDNTKQRNVVNVQNCFGCHTKFVFHGGNAMTGVGGSRQDTRMCALCHTDQRKFGVANSASTATTVAAGDRFDDLSIKNLPVWIHKIHMGERLVKTGYNASNVLLNEVKFPQDVRNCTKCHSNAAQADNWKNVPSRLACGACHDGIDFATGNGIRLSDRDADVAAGKPVGTTQSGHGGGRQVDDSLCTLCHAVGQSQDIKFAHTPVAPIDPANSFNTSGINNGGVPGANTHTNAAYIAGYNSDNLPAGALKISYDLKSVAINASGKPEITFRFMNNSVSPAAPVVFNAAPAAADATVELMPNFVGSPAAYVMAAMPQDGLTDPADFNTSSNVYIRNCWNKSITTCTMAGPDSTGYYKLTITSVTIPTTARMIYGGIGFNDGTTTAPLTQTNVVGYTYRTSDKQGGLNVPAPAVTLLATTGNYLKDSTGAVVANTARRQAVEKARCEKCHSSLGVFGDSNFHGGQRNDPDRCVLCHNPNLNSNGWSISSNAHVHAIHSVPKREADGGPKFTWRAVDTNGDGNPDEGFFNVTYPGVLRNCQACHLPNTVNFGNAANAAQATKLTFRTAAAGAVTAGVNKAPYVAVGAYGTGYSASLATGVVTEATGATLVNSPIANACFSCHTTDSAMSHMRANGGSLYATRTSLRTDATNPNKVVNNEQCLVCHGAGRVADVETMHYSTMR